MPQFAPGLGREERRAGRRSVPLRSLTLPYWVDDALRLLWQIVSQEAAQKPRKIEADAALRAQSKAGEASARASRIVRLLANGHPIVPAIPALARTLL
jgi:hypothetical protein